MHSLRVKFHYPIQWHKPMFSTVTFVTQAFSSSFSSVPLRRQQVVNSDDDRQTNRRFWIKHESLLFFVILWCVFFWVWRYSCPTSRDIIEWFYRRDCAEPLLPLGRYFRFQCYAINKFVLSFGAAENSRLRLIFCKNHRQGVSF